MDDWQVFAEKLSLVILIALSRTCYRIAEWFGRMGLKLEYHYRQVVTP